MSPEDIRELIELISRSDFETFELEREGFRLKLVRRGAGRAVVQHASGAAQPVAAMPAAGDAAAAVVAERGARAEAAPTNEALLEQRSPIVGTFYRSPSPEDAPFVDVGSRIKKGQVTCIVEAMKVMNEIESEFDGEIVEVVVSNGQPVEYGDVLFRIRPGA